MFRKNADQELHFLGHLFTHKKSGNFVRLNIQCYKLYPSDGVFFRVSGTCFGNIGKQAAQECTNCTLISHERTSVHFLVLPDSLSSITEITEYLNFSQSRPWLNLNIEVTKNIVPLVLIIGPISFLWNTFHYISAVRGRSKCELVHSWTVLFPYVSVPVSCFRKDFHPPLLPSFFFTVTTVTRLQTQNIGSE